MSRLIDADKLKEELGKSWAFENTLYDVCRIINEAPTIEARPKGKWIDIGWKGDWQFETDGRGNCWYEYECSECGFHSKGSKSNFCPNCSADMREHKETDHE